MQSSCTDRKISLPCWSLVELSKTEESTVRPLNLPWYENCIHTFLIIIRVSVHINVIKVWTLIDMVFFEYSNFIQIYLMHDAVSLNQVASWWTDGSFSFDDEMRLLDVLHLGRKCIIFIYYLFIFFFISGLPALTNTHTTLEVLLKNLIISFDIFWELHLSKLSLDHLP